MRIRSRRNYCCKYCLLRGWSYGKLLLVLHLCKGENVAMYSAGNQPFRGLLFLFRFCLQLLPAPGRLAFATESVYKRKVKFHTWWGKRILILHRSACANPCYCTWVCDQILFWLKRLQTWLKEPYKADRIGPFASFLQYIKPLLTAMTAIAHLANLHHTANMKYSVLLHDQFISEGQ